MVGQLELYAEVDAGEHGLVQVLLAVRGSDQQHVRRRLETVDLPQQSRQNASKVSDCVCVS